MPEKKRVTAICTECHVEFLMKPYLVKKPVKYGRFCSMQCRAAFVVRVNPASQKRQVPMTCAHCGTAFSLQPYRLLDGSKNHFCSLSCGAKHTLALRYKDGPALTTVICAQCGTAKAIPLWDYRMKQARKQEQFFCNRACFGQWKAVHWQLENNPSWKGGWTPHGKGWAVICNQVRREQRYRCKDCRITEKALGKALDVHHIIAARFFETEEAASARANLVAVCHKCHMVRERHDLPLFWNAPTPPYRKRKQKTKNLALPNMPA
jgi:hypothetical protein